jgi:transcriptional regulator with XRE-family HTH domain
MTTSNRVRERRTALGLRQEDVARRGGVALRTVSAVEHGSPCRRDTQRKILRALGLSFSDREKVFPEEIFAHVVFRPDPDDPACCLIGLEQVEQERAS